MAKDNNGNKHAVVTNDKGKTVIAQNVVVDGRIVADTVAVAGVKQ